MFGFLKKYYHKKTGNHALLRQLEQLEIKRNQQIICDLLIIMETEALRIVLRHIKTVATKYEQAIYRDDYGNIEIDKAFKEVDYFINKTIRNGLASATLPSHISREYYREVLSNYLENMEFLNDKKELIEKFLYINDENDLVNVITSIAKSYTSYLIAHDYSDETLRLVVGDDYQSILNLICRSIVEDELVQIGSIVSGLIPLKDLSYLQKWFCERHEHTDALADIVTGQEFELFCQKRFQELGWDAKTTQTTGDFGADLVIERNGTIIIIQCKYYSQPIGVKAVQEAFSAMTFYNAHKAAVVSNQSFTKAARQMAQKNNVMLLHVNELARLA